MLAILVLVLYAHVLHEGRMLLLASFIIRLIRVMCGLLRVHHPRHALVQWDEHDRIVLPFDVADAGEVLILRHHLIVFRYGA